MTNATHSHRNITVELCVGGIDDVVLAARRAIDRIELNCGMAVGGLTPTSTLAKAAREVFPGPIIAMVRPREGGFVYSDAEHRLMLTEGDNLLETGINGLAAGFLTPDKQINTDRCSEFRRAFPNSTLVFHKAFDFVPDQKVALQQLIDCGFNRILTSAGSPTAMEGAIELSRLHQLAAGWIEILPGGGIRAENVASLIHATGIRQIHSAAREVVSATSSPSTSTGLGVPGGDDFHHGQVSKHKLDELLRAVESIKF
ncbi:MAG: copper homeostasis protein CutC [Planctomycetaceae bacterium]